MTLVPGSILKRKTPFTEDDGDENTDLTVYNEVKIVGPSPTVSQVPSEEWSGQAGEAITISPTTFGAVIDRPQGELLRDYEVTFIPEPKQTLPEVTAVRATPGPTPEEQFSKDALGS